MEGPAENVRLEAIRYVGSFRPWLAAAVLAASVLTAFLSGIGVGFIIPIVELARSGGSSDTAGVVEAFVAAYAFLGGELSFDTAILGVTAVMVLRYALGFLVAYLRTALQVTYVEHLQNRAFERALEAGVAYFDDNGSDEILNAIITQARHAGGFITNGIDVFEALLRDGHARVHIVGNRERHGRACLPAVGRSETVVAPVTSHK
jgi:subfamily B ATP-binding cassette protein MsbA